MKLRTLLASALLMIAASIGASADNINGPTYPAQGGNTFTSTGHSVDAGGLTGNYTLTDTSAYGTQWWSLSVANPYDSQYTGGSSTGNMQFQGEYNSHPNQFYWTDTTALTFYDPSLNADVSMGNELILTINSGLTYDASASAQVGQTLFQIGGSSFNVNLEFIASPKSGPTTDLSDAYNSYNHTCTGCLQTGTDGEFYWTNPSADTPEPSSLLLLGTGLLGAVGTVRRKLSK